MIVNRNYKKIWNVIMTVFGNSFLVIIFYFTFTLLYLTFYFTSIYFDLLYFTLAFAFALLCFIFTKESVKCMLDFAIVSELVLRISWHCTGICINYWEFGIMTTSVESEENPKLILPKLNPICCQTKIFCHAQAVCPHWYSWINI